ncbi:MAG: hypothetical protein J2P20_07825 [Pseudonocardia sp.]|nr:hypothetical protein [Pseudonocardia sp.]
MSCLTRTAVLPPVPAAGPLLTEIADRYPTTVRPGSRAHLTVRHPCVPAERPDGATAHGWAGIAERTGSIDVRFTRCRRNPGDVPRSDLC